MITTNKLIAICGLNCEKCGARIATINNDDELRKEVSRKWCELFQTDIITPEKINCMGCRSAGPHYFFCNEMCKIKPCASAKGYDSCGECPEVDSCVILAEEIGDNEEARKNLK